MIVENKLYIITRSDLSLRYQTPQSIHAAIEFANEFPIEQREWHKNSNSVIILAVENEQKLWEFSEGLEKKGLRICRFREPDVGYELTAVAIVPGPSVKEACKDLPLAGRWNDPNATKRELRLKDIVWDMQECKNSAGQSVMDHGLQVRDYLVDLVQFITDPKAVPDKQWRFPQWLFSYAKKLSENLPDRYTLEKYAIFHDCGKPYCVAKDADGKMHYPGHAEKSYETWKSISDDEFIGELIRRDMEIHTMDSSEIEFFCRDKKMATTLLLAGLAEIHANAELFGGMQSDSFKIKWKKLEKLGDKICKKLFD